MLSDGSDDEDMYRSGPTQRLRDVHSDDNLSAFGDDEDEDLNEGDEGNEDGGDAVDGADERESLSPLRVDRTGNGTGGNPRVHWGDEEDVERLVRGEGEDEEMQGVPESSVSSRRASQEPTRVRTPVLRPCISSCDFLKQVTSGRASQEPTRVRTPVLHAYRFSCDDSYRLRPRSSGMMTLMIPPREVPLSVQRQVHRIADRSV